jgi:hypothetical protein
MKKIIFIFILIFIKINFSFADDTDYRLISSFPPDVIIALKNRDFNTVRVLVSAYNAAA